MNSGVEVGPLTFSGEGQVVLDSDLKVPAELNATDGQPVTLTDGASLGVFSTGHTGPLNVDGGTVNTETNDVTSVLDAASVSFDSTSTYETNIDDPEDRAGSSYGQLNATTVGGVPGNIDLGGASLVLTGNGQIDDASKDDDPTYPACATMRVGETYSLITATGTITGTFSNIAEGSVIPATCSGPGKALTARIHYGAHAVTATAVTTGSNQDVVHFTNVAPHHIRRGHAATIRTHGWDKSVHRPAAGALVELLAHRRGAHGVRVLRTVRLNANGRKTLLVHPKVSTVYQWRSLYYLGYGVRSPRRLVRVRPHHAKASDRN